MKKNEIPQGFYQVYIPDDLTIPSSRYYVSVTGQVFLLKNKKLVKLGGESSKSLWLQKKNGIIELIPLKMTEVPIEYLRLVMGLPKKNPSKLKKKTKLVASRKKTVKKKVKKKVRKNCYI